MSADFLYRQITLQISLPVTGFFLLDMSRTNIGEGREDRTLHRTQHARAPCGTVASNVHVSPNASALAQGLMIQVSMSVAC